MPMKLVAIVAAGIVTAGLLKTIHTVGQKILAAGMKYLKWLAGEVTLKYDLLMAVVESLQETQEKVAALLERATTAVVSLELRKMQGSLRGAEASRLIAAAVGEYTPYGGPDTWQEWHSWRMLEEVRSCWRNGCSKRGVPLSEELWSAVVEAGYQRALEEQPSAATDHLAQETVTLAQKIAFWRRSIPIAGGLPGGDNLMELQRSLQSDFHGPGAAPEVLMGDLVGWRHADLQAFARMHPGESPTAAP